MSTAVQSPGSERQFDLAKTITLAANESLTDVNLQQQGAEQFIALALVATSTGSFKLRIKDADGTQLSNELLNHTNLVGTAQQPAPLFPKITVPGNGVISVDIKDTSGAPNEVQLVFKGVKRFGTGR